MKELFYNRDPDAPDMIRCFNNNFYGVAPTPYDGCNVVFSSFANSNTSNFSFDKFYKYLVMTCDVQILTNGPYSDSIQIFDFKNVRIGHILKTSIGSIRNSIHFLEDASNVNIKAIHILNASNAMKIVLGKFVKESKLIFFYLILY